MSKEAKERPARTLNLFITIKGNRDRIYIGRDVVRALGIPQYVCVKVNADMSALAILPSEEKEYMSFKVPDRMFDAHNADLNVHSKSFVNTILTTNGLDPRQNHSVKGVYAQNDNAVIFKLKPNAADALSEFTNY